MTLVMSGFGISPGLGGGGTTVVENVTVELAMAQVDVTLDDNNNQVTLDPRVDVTLDDNNVDVEVCD
jgi:hypothetical protein